VSETVSGDGWVSGVSITAGNCYYLMVSQWSAGGAGFTIDFAGTTASLNCTILPVELANFEVTPSNGKLHSLTGLLWLKSTTITL
jgi:hypothetical protein